MKQTSLKIKDLIGSREALTFLIGAGCSVDAPSKVPDGNVIKEALINYFCAESEIENIRKIEDLKLEQLLAIIYTSIDEELKMHDYFGLFNEPNLYHFFIADSIIKGSFVMTTNFDSLIESAIVKLKIPYKEIIPVITEEDFINYSNPVELFKHGFKTIYKVHSSAKNVITKEETRDSLVKTIEKLGLNKERKSIFQIEPFKRKFLDNISNGRSLVIMGYSGVNDFDIIPTLKGLKNLKKIIWINHSESIQTDNEIIYEIISGKSKIKTKISKDLITISEKVHEIRSINNVDKIYLIDANTTKMVQKLMQIKPKLSSEILSLRIIDWLKENIKIPDIFEKVLIASRIYYDFRLYNDAMRCSEILMRFTNLAETKFWKFKAQEAVTRSYQYQLKNTQELNQPIIEDKSKSEKEILTMRSRSLNAIANIYHAMGDYSEATKKFEEALKFFKKLRDSKGIINCLNNVASIQYTNKNYHMALKNFYRVQKISNQLVDLSSKCKNYINIGECFLSLENYAMAIKSYLSALKISRKIGFLKEKGIILNKLGEIMRVQEDYSKALKFTMNAVKLNDQLRDWMEKANSFKIIASIKNDQGDYSGAIKFYNKALRIYEQSGNLTEKANSLMIVGNLFKLLGNHSEALNRDEKALKVYNQIGDLNQKAICLFEIANINFSIANYQEALKYYEQVSILSNHLNNIMESSILLKNMGIIFQIQGNFSKALKILEEALVIDEKSGNIKEQANTLYRIATIYLDQKNFPYALMYFNKALKIYNQLKDLNNICLCFDNISNIFRLQGYYLEALNQYKKSLELYEELGDLELKARCFNNIGKVYRIQGNFSEALKAYEEALNLKKELADLRGEAICLNYIGNILRLQGNYSKALKFCLDALRINEDDDFNVKAKCLKNIALINHEQENYLEALKNYKEVLLIYKNYDLIEGSEIREIKEKIENIFLLFQKKNIPRKKEINQSNLAKIKLEKNKTQKIKSQTDSSDLIKESDDNKNLFLPGNIPKTLGDYDRALNFYEEELKKAKESGDLYKRIKIIDIMGKIYKSRGYHQEAIKKYEEALEIVGEFEDKSIKLKIVAKIRALYNDLFEKH
ncbi:MAG: tetratricopeptide repeat protein [Promethearchaeota archaeon]